MVLRAIRRLVFLVALLLLVLFAVIHVQDEAQNLNEFWQRVADGEWFATAPLVLLAVGILALGPELLHVTETTLGRLHPAWANPEPPDPAPTEPEAVTEPDPVVRVPLIGTVPGKGALPIPEPYPPVVVVFPRPGERVRTPFKIHGMANVFENNVTIELFDDETSDWELIEFGDVHGPVGAMVPFDAEVDVAPGVRFLRVGTPSPADGSFIGVELYLTVVDY